MMKKHFIQNKSPVVSKQTVSKQKTPIQREKKRILEFNRYYTLQNISNDVLNDMQLNFKYFKFKYAIKLTVSVKQQAYHDPDQKNFIQLLPRIRNTINDWKFLLKNEYTVEKANKFKNALRLYSENQSCNKYNKDKIISLSNLIFYLFLIKFHINIMIIQECRFV